MTSDSAEIIDRLSQQPSKREIETILKSCIKNSDVPQSLHLKLVVNLLSYTIPEAYPSLTESIKDLITHVFSSLVGIGNLITRIQLSTSNAKDGGSADYQVARTMVKILIGTMKPGLVMKIISDNQSKLVFKEMEKLIFKGKVFSSIAEYLSTSPSGTIDDYGIFENSQLYNDFLISEIQVLIDNGIDMKLVNSLVHSMFSLSPSASVQFLDKYFAKSHYGTLLLIFNEYKTFDKREFLSKHLLPFVNQKFLSNKPSPEKISALCCVLSVFKIDDLVNDPILNKVLHLNNIYLDVLISLILRNNQPTIELMVRKMLILWSDSSLIKSTPISYQENQTHLLVSLSQYSNKHFMKSLIKEPRFLEGISNRLSSFSPNVKLLGMIYANKVCGYAEESQIFEVGPNDFPKLQKVTSIKIEDFNMSLDESWLELEAPAIEEVNSATTANTSVAKLSTQISTKLNLLAIDSDDESDSDDDPTLSRHIKPGTPVYIKDLLSYLSVDVKDSQAYDKRRIALTIAPTLLRQKASFGKEVQFYADDLASLLVGLTNHFDDKDFESLKLNCVVSLIVSYPDVTLHLVRLLMGGDYSLQQRMCILSSLSLSARELKGFQDDVVIQSYETRSFPSQILPQHLHSQFQLLEENHNIIEPLGSKLSVLDYGLNSITRGLQQDFLHDTSERAKDTLSKGKILRISRKLTNPKPTSKQIPNDKNFSKIAGAKFFFPLVNVWHQVGSINIGHYSPLLTAHYIKTLSLILHASYPSATDLQDMIKETFIIITPLKSQVMMEQVPVIESIITSLLLILDIADGEFLVQYYNRELVDFQNWLSENWESIIDDQVKGLAAGLLLQINDLTAKYERLLIDQMSSDFYN